MECDSSVNERCLNMFLDALKFAHENNIDEADKVLHDIEARHNMSYIFMKYAIEKILDKHSSFSKSCAEQRII